MTSRPRRKIVDPPPLWVAQPELRPLALQLAQAARRDLRVLELLDDPIHVTLARMSIEDQIRAVLAAGWRPPATQVSTVDELEALPVITVVTDSDGHPWVRNMVGEWCEPFPTGIDPDELLVDGPVTVQFVPALETAAMSAMTTGPHSASTTA